MITLDLCAGKRHSDVDGDGDNVGLIFDILSSIGRRGGK